MVEKNYYRWTSRELKRLSSLALSPVYNHVGYLFYIILGPDIKPYFSIRFEISIKIISFKLKNKQKIDRFFTFRVAIKSLNMMMM